MHPCHGYNKNQVVNFAVLIQWSGMLYWNHNYYYDGMDWIFSDESTKTHS